MNFEFSYNLLGAKHGVYNSKVGRTQIWALKNSQFSRLFCLASLGSTEGVCTGTTEQELEVRLQGRACLARSLLLTTGSKVFMFCKRDSQPSSAK